MFYSYPQISETLSNVFGHSGFKVTVIYENEYEKVVRDTFLAAKNGVLYQVNVITRGDSETVSFEQLEGRRYYLQKFINKMASTAAISNWVNINY